MNGQELYVFKTRLETKRTGLLHSLQQTRAEVAPAGRRAALQSLMQESRLLWIVEAALKEIAEGVYGTCLLCQTAIPTKRLAAVPWTTHCVRCQDLAEMHVNRQATVRQPPRRTLKELLPCWVRRWYAYASFQGAR